MNVLNGTDCFLISGGNCDREDTTDTVVFNCASLNDYEKDMMMAAKTMDKEHKKININWTDSNGPVNLRLSWWWDFKDPSAK